ncbi:bifunctional diaminohydroxyphosphoribosylaminopyrimidine deaminase/5-amino-6-(5-phosphoribosylamino)uracil reductase RibD [Aquirufa sp.]|jgi:diaminohydroxyphosphoribosylaminopyrimidine deaminase/5-amino-6-(5-phosphoribosylamino)uracil reductase|uniref:bifunctional diaminohydroxyphosphoribosylaminopyrimidine deaminase/5-amino-6-(5-phosphoribosylamino)uracil reductase RibD n=1 Tax=Aquirufa sp. TaxID=2676249 RepID=UPI003782F65D
MPNKEIWMQRAFDLALLGSGRVAPNPLVGCVIVKDEHIIGEGYHQQFGGPHAEVNAIHNASESVEGATAFVTLEPCSHFGKTPPCADLLIQSGIARVYIANLDPNPLVAGKGVEKLEAAGITCHIGLLAETGEWMNRHFFTFHRLRRPYITFKYAVSSDGFIAGPSGVPVQISTELSAIRVHQMRAEHQGILVGVQTIINDNPSLTTRLVAGTNPIRIVLDPSGRIPSTAKVLQDGGETRVLKSTSEIPQLGIQSILVEGGAKTMERLFVEGIVDEIWKIRSPKSLNEGIPEPKLPVKWRAIDYLGDDTWFKAVLKPAPASTYSSPE